MPQVGGGGARVDGFDARVGASDVRVGGFDARVDGFDPRVDGFDPRVDGFDARVGSFDVRGDGFDAPAGGQLAPCHCVVCNAAPAKRLLALLFCALTSSPRLGRVRLGCDSAESAATGHEQGLEFVQAGPGAFRQHEGEASLRSKPEGWTTRNKCEPMSSARQRRSLG
jgi:hypothetical protein